MPLFSVIIPVFNRTHLLEPTLRSVLDQQCQDFELIVVDDGSTEDVAAAIGPYRDRVCLIRQENRGPGEARNLGIRQAAGQYITFLDSDDLWFPWTLSSYRQAIAQYQSPSFIAGEAIHFTQPSRLAAVSGGVAVFRRFDDYLASARRDIWIGTCAAAVRADQLRRVGGFPSHRMLAEESDLWLRLGTAAGFVQIQAPPVFAYRRHAQSAVSDHQGCYRGVCHLIRQERRGAYPGGTSRQAQRRRILTAHIRPVSLACLRRGQWAAAWRLYRSTLGWHLRLGRGRYLTAFPALALLRQWNFETRK